MTAAGWEPANDVERSLVEALARQDAGSYLRVLGTAPLYLPTVLAGLRAGRPPSFVTAILDGRSHLLAFTSERTLAGYLRGLDAPPDGVDGWFTVGLADLAERWPEPSWLLAVNPGTPAGALLPVEVVAAAMVGGDDPHPAPDPMPDPGFEPANETERGILRALRTGDPGLLLDSLVGATLLMPTERQVAAGGTVYDPDFPWRTSQAGEGEGAIVTFTSRGLLAGALPHPPPGVRVRFANLARAWPDPALRLVVDPGSPIELEFPGDRLPDLAGWLDNADRPDDAEEPAPAANPTGADPAGTDPTGPDPTRPGWRRPVLLQKAVLPGTVRRYLDDGYDRVGGFVHPADAVAALRTPAALYSGLGLAHPGAAFHPDDAAVHVLRWLGHLPALYRVARGGRDPAALALMGGWVVEHAPFLGTGRAPGTADAPELLVHSVVLPHGAELLRLDRDGVATLVATWDADVRSWSRAG